MRAWTVRILAFKQAPDHRVAPAVEETRGLADGTFVGEAEFARDGGGGEVGRVAVNLHFVDMANFEGDLGQRG